MCKQYTIFNKKTHFANFKGKILYEILGNPGQTSLWIQQLWADPPLTPFAEQDQTSSPDGQRRTNLKSRSRTTSSFPSSGTCRS